MKLALVHYEGLTTLDLVGPAEILTRLPGVEHFAVAVQPGPVENDAGALTLVADTALSDLPDPDIVLVPGGMEGTLAAAEDQALLAWLRAASERGAWMTSVCTGALILGAAGLLEGKEATTHWAAMDRLAGYGAIPKRERVVAHPKLVTAAGVSAGIDMALWLAAELHGPDIAELLQLGIEYDPAPPFDSGSPAKARPEILALSQSVLGATFAADG